MKNKSQKGFTMIELIMVIVILAILFAVAVPRYLDLSTQAKENATRASLGAIRAAVAIQYASNAAAGTASYPASVSTNMFADNRIPPEQVIATAASVSTSIIVGVATTTNPLGGWLYNSTAGTAMINTSNATYSAW
jgi:MSHA pilin protein MshA